MGGARTINENPSIGANRSHMILVHQAPVAPAARRSITQRDSSANAQSELILPLLHDARRHHGCLSPSLFLQEMTRGPFVPQLLLSRCSPILLRLSTGRSRPTNDSRSKRLSISSNWNRTRLEVMFCLAIS